MLLAHSVQHIAIHQGIEVQRHSPFEQIAVQQSSDAVVMQPLLVQVASRALFIAGHRPPSVPRGTVLRLVTDKAAERNCDGSWFTV